jgi:hypothetical protein
MRHRLMRIASWNAEHLSDAKQTAVMAAAEALTLDAIIVVETWMTASRPLPQPATEGWCRLDYIHYQANHRARRGKGGISLLIRTALAVRVRFTDPYRRWIMWEAAGISFAGVYAEPSVSLDHYSSLLDSLAAHIGTITGPVVVMGDFNARLGQAVGDHATNDRRSLTMAFVAQSQLTLLNSRLRRDDSRWTWTDGLGARSVVDLAMAARSPCSALHVVAPPTPTCHQFLIVTVATDDVDIVTGTDRWNWARRCFTNRQTSKICAAILTPVLQSLSIFWKVVGDQLDAQIEEEDDDDPDSDLAAQCLVDDAYESTCLSLRTVLSRVACWSPSLSRRSYNPLPHVNWADMEDSGNCFMLSKVKSVLAAHRDRQILEQNPDAVPTPAAFAEFYTELFRADGAFPEEPFHRVRKPVRAVDADEAKAFSVTSVQGLVGALQPKKAIGPDNIPADMFRTCPGPSAMMLSQMFRVLWAHQTLPRIWRRSFIRPIPKKTDDPQDPANWRGIALQSHIKKMFESVIRRYMRDKKWTRTDILQTGFQPRTGALDAVYAVDEVTQRYDRMGQPLIMVLLDIKKAYDRTPRAFVYRKLKDRCVPGHVIGVLQALLDYCTVEIRVDGVSSEPVCVQVGVPQGDVLSPDLFNVYIDDLPRRLVRTCQNYGGCPKYGGVDIPCIMYADDQTLLHWRPDAMQAMLQVCQQYADEHLYRYNVRKSEVCYNAANIQIPLYLDGDLLPVVDETSLLGVTVRDGMIDHVAQLEDRVKKAEQAMFGLDQIGALRTDQMSPAKKRLIIMAYGRSRIEYGMAIFRHSARCLHWADKFVMDQLQACLGGRGTVLSMRFCGLVPAESRSALLRLRFLDRMRSQVVDHRLNSVAVRCYLAASTDERSCLQKMFRRCPFYERSQALAAKYRLQFLESHGIEPCELMRLIISSTADRTSLRQLTWARREARSKLLPIQQQDFDAPHPTARICSPAFAEISKWMTNRIPGAHLPCINCDGARNTSRYHLTRCTDPVTLMGPAYDLIQHAKFLPVVDNPVDAMAMSLLPNHLQRAVILVASDRCPALRRPQPTAAPPADGPHPSPPPHPPDAPPNPPASRSIAPRTRARARISRPPVPTRLPRPAPAPASPRTRPGAALIEEPPPWRDPEWIARASHIGATVQTMRELCCRRPDAAPPPLLPHSPAEPDMGPPSPL